MQNRPRATSYSPAVDVQRSQLDASKTPCISVNPLSLTGHGDAILPHQGFNPFPKTGNIGALPRKKMNLFQSVPSAKTEKETDTSSIPASNVLNKCVFRFFVFHQENEYRASRSRYNFSPLFLYSIGQKLLQLWALKSCP